MEVIVLCGLPGSGKSTFCREQLYNTHIRLNLDMLKTRHREKILLEAMIAAKQPFVVDNTNPKPADRARYIVPAKAAGFRVAIYYFSVPFHVASARNMQRPTKAIVPEKGMAAILKAMTIPTWEEGVDSLFRVSSEDGFNFDLHEDIGNEF